MVTKKSKYIIRDWMNNILFDGKEFDSFEEGWGHIHEVDPQPDESDPNWVDGWYDDYFVIEKGYSVTGKKEKY